MHFCLSSKNCLYLAPYSPALGLTWRSSQPAYAGRLSYFIRSHKQCSLPANNHERPPKPPKSLPPTLFVCRHFWLVVVAGRELEGVQAVLHGSSQTCIARYLGTIRGVDRKQSQEALQRLSRQLLSLSRPPRSAACLCCGGQFNERRSYSLHVVLLCGWSS